MGEFYIVMNNPHGSDYALFWRPDREGYTRIITNAGKYSREEAEAICRLRREEFMIPCVLADRMAIKVIDFGELMVLKEDK